MPNRMLVVSALVAVAGCASIARLRGDAPASPQVTGGAEIIPGSIAIIKDGGDLALRCEMSTHDLARNPSVTLTGPGGVDASMGSLYVRWDDAWPAGTYKLTVTDYDSGAVLNERAFEVRLAPRAYAQPAAVVVQDGVPPVVVTGQSATLLIAANVVMPEYAVEAVWMRDHRVVAAETELVSIEGMIDMVELGQTVRLTFSAAAAPDAGELYVFVDGDGLYGAWSWLAHRDQPVALAAAQPDAHDLAAARKAARAEMAKSLERHPDLGATLAGGEALACAIASDEQARDAYREWRQSRASAGATDDAGDDKLTRAARDPYLSDDDRAQLRVEGRADHEAAAYLAGHVGTHMAKAMRVAKKYRPGCLAALGVQALPPGVR